MKTFTEKQVTDAVLDNPHIFGNRGDVFLQTLGIEPHYEYDAYYLNNLYGATGLHALHLVDKQLSSLGIEVVSRAHTNDLSLSSMGYFRQKVPWVLKNAGLDTYVIENPGGITIVFLRRNQ